MAHKKATMSIEIKEGVCGGEPVIIGTRISMRTIQAYVELGWGFERLHAEFPHVPIAVFADAYSRWMNRTDWRV